MDRAAALRSAEAYAKEVRKILNPASIILFGSYVNGTPTADSDIDIAVVFNGFDGDRWKTSSALWHLTWGVDDRIEPILLDSTNDPSGFVADVFKTGELIYSAENS